MSKIFFLSLLLVSFYNSVYSQISGTVYRDYNFNGTRQTTNPIEPLVNGVTVRATLANGTVVTKTTSGTTAPNYSFTSGEVGSSGAVRIEFVLPAIGNCINSGIDFSSFAGTDNGTSVQFVNANTSNVNFAVSNPSEHNTGATGVMLHIPIELKGDPTAPGSTVGGLNWFAGFPYSNSGTTAPTLTLNGRVIGSCWGQAYSKQAQKIFTSAFIKRHSGLGVMGSGGIYLLTPTSTSYSVTQFFDMDNNSFNTAGTPTTRTRAASTAPAYGVGSSYTINLTGSSGTTASYLGAIDALTGLPSGFGVVGTNVQRGLGTTASSSDFDPVAFDQVGKVGIGDIDISDDGKYLFVTNLYSRKIFRLTLNDAYNPTSVTAIAEYNLPTVAVTNGVLRPFALKFYRDRLYIGTVASGENNGVNNVGGTTDLYAHILQLNDPTATASFATTPVVSYPLNYTKGGSNGAFGTKWNPWTNNASSGVFLFTYSLGNAYTYPTPMLTDIEFTDNQDIVMAFTDRSGHQWTNTNRRFLSGTNDLSDYRVGGDVLIAGKSCNTGLYTIENNGAYTSASGTTYSSGTANNQGPGNSEFFKGDTYPAGFHTETSQGAMAVLQGTNDITLTAMDPVNGLINSGGLIKLNTTTGAAVGSGYNIYTSLDLQPDFSMSKANGLGDIELTTPLQPIQIGNRIWLDTNGDGVQDATETTAGVPTGTTVTLRSPGLDGIYGNGDDQTWTTTTDANGNYYFGTLSTPDNRKPASWTGIGNNILPGYDYRVEVATPTGTQVTKSNAAANSVDNIDNDAIASGTNAIVAFNTSNTNHNFDIGFKTLASIGDRVWLDNGVGSGTANDGVQNGTEPGVAGVTVTLYQNGADGLPGTADDVVIGSTVTDAFGNYLFDNLTPSTSAATSYNVGFTLPANHQFTTQTNTQVTGTSNATNTTTTSGGSTAANGSDANTTTGRTGSFWLAPGEAERGADAGLIFNTPTLLNSIGDRVWFDNGLGGGTAGNGVQDGTEPGVAGVTVQLLDDVTGAVIATTVTDANGNYIFTGLPANTNYKVKVIPPAGTVFTTTTGTTPGNGTTDSDVNATLTSANYGTTATVNTGAAGTQITGIDAGIVSQAANTASLGDRVWNDLNSDGTQDAGEPGIAGVTVNLYEDVDGDGVLTGGELVPVRTAVTDAFGNYIFNNLIVTANNAWQVEFVQPVGYSNTPVLNNNSGGDATDSDIADNGTDRTGFIKLKADERNTSVDAGFVQSAPAGSLVLGDRVWRDNNANGQQDATEPGVAGVTAKLYQNGPDGLPGTADDVLVGTTTTDINGNYQFVNLAASTNAATNYNVQFSNLPSGFVFTTQDAGADVSDSDVNSLGVTNSINLTANNQTIDAGITQGVPSGLGSLGDKVWYDLDNDGVQDAGELGVAGVAVNLFRDANNDGIISGAELTPIATTTTNPLGEYMFTSLPAGTYQVGFTLPTALNTYALSAIDAVAATDATDSDGNPKNTSIAGNTAGVQTSYTGLIALGQGQDNVTVDLGIVPPANTNTLGGTAWFDTDSDGSQTGNPGRVPGVLVILYNSAGVAIATTTTDENGDYLFVGLADGDYSVGFSNYPAGFDLTTKSATNDATGSDADRVSGRTPTVTLNAGNRNDRSLDAGLISTRAALGNRVWDDLNGDGIQDAGEPGIEGVQVILYASDGITVLASTITDQNGNYLFANLDAGNYIVGVNPATIPAGMQFTTQNNITGPDGDGANTWTGGGDSDVTNTGFTATITLAAGQVNLTVDAGVRRTPIATVGNRVWDDLNGDGIQDAGEPGISGVIATLYNSANQPIGSAVTDGNGNWLITNVPTGTGYYVIFSNKPAGDWTLQDQGANGTGTGGATESDADSDVNTATGQTGTFDVTPNTINVKIDAGILQSITLPVKYTSFIASKNNNTSLLRFTIAQPATGSTFTIERSVTGTNFTAIGTIVGTNATSYTYTDVMPILTARNYYRIKEVDAQGKVSYSEIRMVKFTKDGKVDIYPIPAATNISITFGDEVIYKPIVISIYNQQGQELMRKQISRANATEVIDIASFANGTYQLRVTSNTELITNRKVVIMK